MRIIAGRLKGRVLKSFKSDHIRPTMDRVKESLFNKLAFYVEGARCLDLFSGTGSLAFEAISRGAEFVVSVENHPKSIALIQANQKLLGVGPEHQIVQNDVFRFLRDYQGPAFDLILIDPPFTQQLSDSVMEALAGSGVFARNTLVAIESAKKEKIESKYLPFELLDRRSFGDKYLNYYEIPESPHNQTESTNR